jgi:hypothetical protein
MPPAYGELAESKTATTVRRKAASLKNGHGNRHETLGGVSKNANEVHGARKQKFFLISP